jgi:hypothetical protein
MSATPPAPRSSLCASPRPRGPRRLARCSALLHARPRRRRARRRRHALLLPLTFAPCPAPPRATRSALYGSDLKGTISPLIGAFVDITGFFVEGNDLSGTVPASLSNWRKIEDFWVAGNRFSGALPAMSFGTMTNGCSLLAQKPFTNSFACPWPAGAKAQCKKCNSVCSKNVPITDSDCHPTPAPTPPPPSYKCASGQCVPGSSGLSKADCESMCIVKLFQCVSNKCTPASTGVSQAKCEAACGSSLRGVVALE